MFRSAAPVFRSVLQRQYTHRTPAKHSLFITSTDVHEIKTSTPEYRQTTLLAVPMKIEANAEFRDYDFPIQAEIGQKYQLIVSNDASPTTQTHIREYTHMQDPKNKYLTAVQIGLWATFVYFVAVKLM